ncbi:MAG TPA: DegT/DnrJ/EryC1/StrS family aminotransferase [Verrucomicrobiae bacterium]|nr:DegT/DnrJ/EryC1/StrS family aminotransferase [Verrucomicrobiae bacterium]
MSKRLIPVAAPVLAGNEKVYVTDCLDSSWISSVGKYVDKFESALARFCKAKHAISCCNGTAALHLILMALGVEPGDEVIVPTLTFVATANAVAYCGARPVFVDSESQSWNIDPTLIEQKITPATKGIIPVHLFGQPADMDSILALAGRCGLFVVEDAAEAHGAQYKGRMVGSIGVGATFSFYGNKIFTTGEGGAVVTSDDRLAGRVRFLKDQAMDPTRRYWFPSIGYNYRMTNIEAAIGLAQLEQADWHTKRRLEVAAWYREQLRGTPGVTWQTEQPESKHAFWMFTIMLDETISLSRDEVMLRLLANGIETRPVFHPVHTLPPYRKATTESCLPVAEQIARRGISLPTWAGLTQEDVLYVTECLKSILKSTR